MAASFSDMNLLRQDQTFQGRVQQALVLACVNISNEGWTVAFHRERQTYAAQILNSPSNYSPLFAGTVATDPTCISDATQGGTVALTSGNAATQAALVTDTHISNAISAEFNAYFRVPA